MFERGTLYDLSKEGSFLFQINQLLDMGFSRERVMSALRRSNNDTTVATTLLIDES